MKKRAAKRGHLAPLRAGHVDAGEIDELIRAGRDALTAPGRTPLALHLDTALRVAGLHVRRAEQPEATQRVDDLRSAVTLATFVARHCVETPPAGVVELGSRAVAILDLCAQHLPIVEASSAEELANQTRERIARAEQLVAVSLDRAITSLGVARALLAHVPATHEREAVVTGARSLLATAAAEARRAGEEQLAQAALALMPQAEPNINPA